MFHLLLPFDYVAIPKQRYLSRGVDMLPCGETKVKSFLKKANSSPGLERSCDPVKCQSPSYRTSPEYNVK